MSPDPARRERGTRRDHRVAWPERDPSASAIELVGPGCIVLLPSVKQEGDGDGVP